MLCCLALALACIGAASGCGDDGDNAIHQITPTAPPVATRSVAPTLPATATPVFSPTPQPTPVGSGEAVSTNGGGCYPTGISPAATDMLSLVDPEWAPIPNGMSVDVAPVLIHGTAIDVHGDTGGDFPATHVRSDQNTIIQLDDADAFRLASGNLTPGDEEGLIALEWEAGAYPAFAWAGVGDRVVALGRWIFDCGHPDPAPGHCSGTSSSSCVLDTDCRPPTCPSCGTGETCVGTTFAYRSELHPPQAVAAIRSGRGAVISGSDAVPATRADVFVSAFGGGAGDRCILSHQQHPTDLLSKVDCFPLTQPVAPINATDFVFDLPMPEQAPGSQAVWRVLPVSLVPDVPGNSLQSPAQVAVSGPVGADRHLEVRVLMTQPDESGKLPTGYAGTILAGWDTPSSAFTHVRVTVESVVIVNALQPQHPAVPRTCMPSGQIASGQRCATDRDCPNGETCSGPVKSWRLQVAVNGEWQELGGLDHVSAGDVIPQGLTFEQYLPSGGSLHLFANGDGEDCIESILGQSLKTDLGQFGFAAGLKCLTTTAHDPGVVDVSYASPDFGAGTDTMEYETRSTGGLGGSCSGSTESLCVVDDDCPSGETCQTTGGAFALRYQVQRLP